MKVVSSPRYEVDIGAHVFPTHKYRVLREGVVEGGLVTPAELIEPPAAAWEDLALVHTADYLDKLRTGRLSTGEIAQLELPWSADVVEGFRVMAGGTIVAARLALAEGIAVQLGGGLHHAHPDHGEGFCLFNDVAVAVRVLQRDRRVRRCAILDCDVHHGNGTAIVFRDDPDVLTLSIHQANNYPGVKPPSTIDIDLRDGTTDREYLAHLGRVLPAAVDHRPDLAFYLAGADPFWDDQLGGLALTFGGLRARDALVLSTLRRAGIPVVVTLAGGYARHAGDTIAIHYATVEEAIAALSR